MSRLLKLLLLFQLFAGFWPTDAQGFVSAQAVPYMHSPTTVDPATASMIPRYASWSVDPFYHDMEQQ